MTHVSNPAADIAGMTLKEYQIDVITFDGEVVTVWQYARNAEEAQEMAAAEVDGADYTMVQAVYSLSSRR